MPAPGKLLPALWLGCAAGAALCLALAAGQAGGPGTWTALAVHIAAPVAAWVSLRRKVSARVARAAAAAGLVSLACGLEVFWTGLPREVRAGLVSAHVVSGSVALMLLAAGAIAACFPPRRSVLATLSLALLLVPAGLFLAGERSAFAWQPPRYDAATCYRFLTATTAEQAGTGEFPSALRRTGTLETGCEQTGCHAGIAQHAQDSAHARGASGRAYAATLSDYVARRGEDAARWCRGCHEPETSTRSVGCTGCHAAVAVSGGHGAAGLTLAGVKGREPRTSSLDVRLRPYAHATRLSNAALLKAAEFCGSCHRKHWSLPQNEYRWMEGPDEFRSWQASQYSGTSLFAAGDPQAARSCVGCHDPHGGKRVAGDRPSALTLDLHLRPATGEPGAVPGPAQVDVVIHNQGVGHDFPYGMPDLNEAWLEVTVQAGGGRAVARSGGVAADGKLDRDAHAYRLVGLDRRGEVAAHGNLDEMVSVREWRRIGPGQSDLARYTLPRRLPANSRVVARLLRRRRPDFARWAGEKMGPVQVLAEATRPLTPADARQDAEPRSLRRYGAALASVKAYPEALRVLLQARGVDAADGETDLALGRVYLLEGDLLAARDAFLRVAAKPVDGLETGVPSHDRARAWEAAVLRRIGQSDEAAKALAELARKYPRDRQLRFELGLTRMALLDHEAAAREFEAALDVDPLDSAAHYNLMISQQRLNQITRARREETLYRLLSDTAPLPLARPRGGGGEALEASPLHVHRLERVR